MWSKRAEPSGFPRNIWFTKVKMCYFSVLCVSISENWFIVNWFVCYFVPHLRLLCLISIQRNKSLSKPELTDPGGGFYRFPQICNRRIIFPPWQRQRCFQRKARRDLTSNDVQHRTNRHQPRRAGLVAQIKMENEFIVSCVSAYRAPQVSLLGKTETDGASAERKVYLCKGIAA